MTRTSFNRRRRNIGELETKWVRKGGEEKDPNRERLREREIERLQESSAEKKSNSSLIRLRRGKIVIPWIRGRGGKNRILRFLSSIGLGGKRGRVHPKYRGRFNR